MRKVFLAAAFLALASPVLAGGKEEVFEKTYSMEGVSRVSVENVNGHIEATAWDKPNFKVRAVKKATGGRAEETLRLTEIRVTKVGDEIRVETINPKRRRLFGFLDFGGSNADVDYTLQIPGPHGGALGDLQRKGPRVGVSGHALRRRRERLDRARERRRADERLDGQRIGAPELPGTVQEEPRRDGQRLDRHRVRQGLANQLRRSRP